MRKRIACLGMVLTLTACRSDNPEAQIRKRFEACRAAIEAGDAAAAASPLDAAFQGPEGMDRATARLFLLGALRQEKVGVTVVRNEVMVRGNEGFEEVDLILTGRAGGLLPQDASHRHFHLQWRRTDGTWTLLEVQSLEGR